MWGFLFYLFDYYFFLRERETESSWVGREVARIWEELEEAKT